MKQTQRTEKKAEFLPSLLVMVAAILVLVGGILVLKLDPHIPLIMCTFVLVFYGLCEYSCRMRNPERQGLKDLKRLEMA